MKKKLVALLMSGLLLVAGCGNTVPQADFDALNESYSAAVADLDAAKAESESLKKELDALKEQDTVSPLDLGIAECKAAAASDKIGIMAVFDATKKMLSTLDTTQWETDLNDNYDQYIRSLDNIKSTYGVVDLLKEQGKEVDEDQKMEEILTILNETRSTWETYRDGIYKIFTE